MAGWLKGINLWASSDEWSFVDSLKAARAGGFDSVEPNLATKGPVNLRMSRAEARKVVRLTTKHRLKIRSLSTGLFWEAPLTSPDPKVRAKGVAIGATMLQVASWIGAEGILVVPGVVNAETSYDQAWDRAQASLRAMLPHAERARVAICVENVWNKFLLSPLEMRRFVDDFAHPLLKVYFDVGNVMAFGLPDQWIRILGSRIKLIHLKDFRTAVANFGGFVDLLEGNVPWLRVAAALKDTGYTGPLTVEVGPRSHDNALYFKQIAQSVASIIRMAPKT